MPGPNSSSGSPRASRAVKLVLMGVAGAALLYSCAPGVGAGLGAMPYLWFLPNPFFRGPAISAAPSSGAGAPTTTTTPAPSRAAPAPTQSQRGGFGATGNSGSGSGSS